jgi:putative ABC transport system permease protein
MNMETFGHDLKFAARMLRRNTAFSLLIVGMLALALGANTALFSFADAVLFRPLPFANPERLVLIKGAVSTVVEMGFEHPEKFMQRNQTVQSLEYIAAYDSGRANLADDRVPERIQVMRVSADFFPMLGINPMKGRWFGQDEQQKGTNRVLILSHA